MVEEAPLCCILSEKTAGFFQPGKKEGTERKRRLRMAEWTQGTESEERLSYDDLSPEKNENAFRCDKNA